MAGQVQSPATYRHTLPQLGAQTQGTKLPHQDVVVVVVVVVSVGLQLVHPLTRAFSKFASSVIVNLGSSPLAHRRRFLDPLDSLALYPSLPLSLLKTKSKE